MSKETKIIKRLDGHSGCNIILAQVDNHIIVEKSSSNKDYNFRLKKQCKKQMKFIPLDNVCTPKIYNCYYTNDLFSFSMEYIKGKTLSEFFNEISILEIADYIKCLFECLYTNTNLNNSGANNVFRKKIIALKNKLSDFENLKTSFKILENFNWENIQKSPCHGDLTLENIIITQDKQLYLIDFLDSFYNSWMIDIAKLLQDLEFKWSYRNKFISTNTELRLLVAKQALIEEILKLDNGKRILDTIYHILLLNIVRIYPYAKDLKTLNFLDNIIIKLESTLKSNKIGALL